MAHHRDHAFSSWFSNFVASRKLMMWGQPTSTYKHDQTNILESPVTRFTWLHHIKRYYVKNWYDASYTRSDTLFPPLYSHIYALTGKSCKMTHVKKRPPKREATSNFNGVSGFGISFTNSNNILVPDPNRNWR